MKNILQILDIYSEYFDNKSNLFKLNNFISQNFSLQKIAEEEEWTEDDVNNHRRIFLKENPSHPLIRVLDRASPKTVQELHHVFNSFQNGLFEINKQVPYLLECIPDTRNFYYEVNLNNEKFIFIIQKQTISNHHILKFDTVLLGNMRYDKTIHLKN